LAGWGRVLFYFIGRENMIVGWEVEKVKAGAVVGLLMVPIIEMEKKEELKEGEVKIEVNRGNEKPPMIGGEPQVRLFPGYNEITDEVWNKIKVHLTSKILDKQIVYLSKRGKDEETGDMVEEGIPLGDLKPEKAKEVIWNCFDVTVLERWKAEYAAKNDLIRTINLQFDGIAEGKVPDEKIGKGK